MHLARELRKFRADMLGVFLHMVAQRFQQCTQFAVLFRKKHRRLGLLRRRLAFSFRADQRRRHDRLLHLGRLANRARNELPLDLHVASARIREPALEFVAARANKAVPNHEARPTTCSRPVSFGATSKRRPCCSDGMRRRASATSAGSISTMMTPGSM